MNVPDRRRNVRLGSRCFAPTSPSETVLYRRINAPGHVVTAHATQHIYMGNKNEVKSRRLFLKRLSAELVSE
jgi:hypothetical protein